MLGYPQLELNQRLCGHDHCTTVELYAINVDKYDIKGHEEECAMIWIWVQGWYDALECIKSRIKVLIKFESVSCCCCCWYLLCRCWWKIFHLLMMDWLNWLQCFASNELNHLALFKAIWCQKWMWTCMIMKRLKDVHDMMQIVDSVQTNSMVQTYTKLVCVYKKILAQKSWCFVYNLPMNIDENDNVCVRLVGADDLHLHHLRQP